MKIACKFCQREFVPKKDYSIYPNTNFSIDCQVCRVDFIWRDELCSPLDLIQICYRLRDPKYLFKYLYLNFDSKTTTLILNFKQHQFKNNEPITFNGITEVQPKDALNLAYRYKKLIIFS